MKQRLGHKERLYVALQMLDDDDIELLHDVVTGKQDTEEALNLISVVSILRGMKLEGRRPVVDHREMVPLARRLLADSFADTAIWHDLTSSEKEIVPAEKYEQLVAWSEENLFEKAKNDV